MSEPFIGEIKMVGFNFAPRGWSTCAGQLLSISQNTALFSLLGTTYGGDGRTTFGLPDLRSRSPIGGGMGAGPGLDTIQWGAKGGAISHTLTTNQIPSHNHAYNVRVDDADLLTYPSTPPAVAGLTKDSTGAFLPLLMTNGSAAAQVATESSTISNTGGSQSFNMRNPYLGILFVIALVGLFPSRN